MNQPKRFQWKVCALAIGLSVMITPMSAQSQAPESNLITVEVVRVHPGMMWDFVALQREINPELQEAGLQSRQIWSVVRGSTNEFQIVTPADKYADYDEESILVKTMSEAGRVRWLARLRECIQSNTVYTLTYRPELSIPLEEEQEPSLMVLTTVIHAPGMGSEYAEWLEKELLPAQKEAGVRGIYRYRAVFGGSARAWVTARLVDNWEQFDSENPVRASMGDEAFEAMQRKGGSMTVDTQRLVLRYRPGMSF